MIKELLLLLLLLLLSWAKTEKDDDLDVYHERGRRPK